MKHSYLVLLFVALVGCNSKTEKKAAEAIDPKLLISCEGIGDAKLTDTYADLQTKFGDSVLSAHENNVRGKYTTIWESDPRQINIYWVEQQEPFKTVRYMEVTDGMAPYMTADSIAVGMPLKELVKKNNGMALTFKNFSANTEPGVIREYNNGDIPIKNPCFGGTLEWTGQKAIDVNELRAFQEQQEVKSFDRILQRYDVVLSSITITKK